MVSARTVLLPRSFPVACHTDYVGVGTCFVAIPGQKLDGMLYIPQAIAKGATTVVVQKDVKISKDVLDLMHIHGVALMHVENARKMLGILSAKAAGYPAHKLKILGVTGTKGKTTSVYMLEALLKKMGKKVARLSTVANAIDGVELPALLTTPQPDYLHQFFSVCVAQGIEYVAMEVAAQAITFDRLETLSFDGLVFTNLEREHGELYPTMEEYFGAKCAIIQSHLKPGAICVVNADNAYGKQILDLYPSLTHGFSCAQEVSQGVVQVGFNATQVRFTQPNGITPTTSSLVLATAGLVGEFNVRNFAGVALMLAHTGCDLTSLEHETITIPKIPGRLEGYALSNGARAYIDYAHTPGSFESLLSVMRTLTDHLIVVFGAGGNKDKSKRPLMGAAAAHYADVVIITNDNPRTEAPENIVADILGGITVQDKVIVEFDRKKAIELAFNRSHSGSIIMLLGKGTDEYQIVGVHKNFFSEKEILQTL